MLSCLLARWRWSERHRQRNKRRRWQRNKRRRCGWRHTLRRRYRGRGESGCLGYQRSRRRRCRSHKRRRRAQRQRCRRVSAQWLRSGKRGRRCGTDGSSEQRRIEARRCQRCDGCCCVGHGSGWRRRRQRGGRQDGEWSGCRHMLLHGLEQRSLHVAPEAALAIVLNGSLIRKNIFAVPLASRHL